MDYADAGTETDNGSTRLRRICQHIKDWAAGAGKSDLETPDTGDNDTTVWRKVENNLFQLAK